jgi:hypothetical protein
MAPPKRHNGSRLFNSRVATEGRWEEAAAWKATLKRDGLDDRLIWRVVCNLMPPLDGSLPEGRLTADLEPIITKYAGQKPELPVQPRYGKREGFYDRSAGKAEMTTTPTYDKFAKEVMDSKSTWKGEWELVAQRVPPDKVSPEVEVVRWVFNNAGTPPWDLKPEDVPSLGALKYLQHVQYSPINYADFVKTNWSKMLPDKKTLEMEARYQDDGRRFLSKLDAVLTSMEGDEDGTGAD